MKVTVSKPRKAQAIFAATLELLAERGYDALAIEAVAARAGVNKTTIYRSWAAKDELLAAAFRDAPVLALQVPDTGSLRGDLIDVAQQIATLLSEEPSRRIAAVMLAAAPDRPATAQVTAAFFADRLQQERCIFERAEHRRELKPGTDPAAIMDLLGGALWFRILIRSEPAGAGYIAALVDAILAGVASGVAGPAIGGHPRDRR
ncbi:TetR/AcrR family transcriptional regulator [Ruania zhangjianzhongii]|uniref:TetR/AcrR family transcriptional regulator n=1 Tax=Ruania zhangjianzhongii TaxID=2603206 RepID=UPI0011C8CA58|nr:TetR/AcrR family transcriptional regulator [Ruania zhangjianzhongii]